MKTHNEEIYKALEDIKYIAQGMNSTNVHQKRVEIRDLCNKIQMQILED